MSQGFYRQSSQHAALKQMSHLHASSMRDASTHNQPKPALSACWTTGIEPIDACLPEGGLDRAGLHEITPLKQTEMPSLTGFTFGLLARLRSCQPIIWCVTEQQVGEYGQLYAFGLERFGISPANIIFAKVRHALDLHFALEEALKTDGVAAVIGEGPRPNFTGSRRLSLLCKTHKRPCLLMSPQNDEGRGSAALTRFQITPTQSVEDPRDPYGPGLPTWYVAMPRIRGGQSMPHMEADMQQNTSYPWRICWDDQTHSFRAAAIFSNRAAHQNAQVSTAAPPILVGKTGTM